MNQANQQVSTTAPISTPLADYNDGRSAWVIQAEDQIRKAWIAAERRPTMLSKAARARLALKIASQLYKMQWADILDGITPDETTQRNFVSLQKNVVKLAMARPDRGGRRKGFKPSKPSSQSSA